MQFAEKPTLRAMRRFRPMSTFCAMLFAALVAWPAHAHKSSDAYLQLWQDGDAIALRWDIALRDLDAALDLDRNGDRKLSWGEVRARLDGIEAYVLPRLRLQQGRCVMVPTEAPALEDRIDGAYLVLRLAAPCAVHPTLDIDYRLFREIDPTHRGLLVVESGLGNAPRFVSLEPTAGVVQVDWPGRGAPDALVDPPDGKGGASLTSSEPNENGSILREGVHRFSIGYVHVLFLACLLLPLRMRPSQNALGAEWAAMLGVTVFVAAQAVLWAATGHKPIDALGLLAVVVLLLAARRLAAAWPERDY